MHLSIRRRLRAQRGMTLVELGMVLAVMVVILSVTVPRVSALADTAKQEACAKDLVNLHTTLGAITEKLGYPQPGFPGGVVVPRTSMAALGTLPLDIATSIDEMLPPGFDGRNPLNDQPYFISLVKPNIAGVGILPHDVYQLTLDTCIPDSQVGVQNITAREINIDCAQCGGTQCLASFDQTVVLSTEARSMRKLKRMLYCCESELGVSGSTYDLLCDNWRNPGGALTPGFTESLTWSTSNWTANSYLQQFCSN